MLYSGFSKLEIDRIVAILEKHNIEYTVGVPSDLGDGKKIPRDSSVMQLDLTDEELMRVPEADRMKLADMRIHGEMESPYTEEELKDLENYVKPVSKKAKEQSKMQQWATILAVGIMMCLYLYKKMHL